MKCNYKTDEIHLRRLINRDTAPTNEDSELKVNIQYKTSRSSKLQSKIFETKSMTLLYNIMLSTRPNVKGIEVAPLQHKTLQNQCVRSIEDSRCILKMVS